MNINECYEIFEISSDSTEKDIKTKYKKLVLAYHPDRNKSTDTTKQFIRINEAYKILLDSKKKPQIYPDNFNTFWTFSFSTGNNTGGVNYGY